MNEMKQEKEIKMENKLRKIIREELQTQLNENRIKVGNAVAEELRDFLKIVEAKSKGYVNGERDSALLLFDILKHRYNIG